MRRTYTLLFIILVFKFVPLSAASELSPFHLEVSVGFQGIIPTQSWVPVNLFIDTNLPSFSGTIALKLPFGNIYTNKELYYSVIQEVFFTGTQKKKLQFTLPIHHAGKLEVSIKDDKKIIYSETISIVPVTNRNHKILIPGKITDFDFLRDLNRKESIEYQTIYVHPDMLPETVAGYSIFDSVILHEARLSGLSEIHSRALQEWVKIGGQLFVTGSIYRRGDLPSILLDLLPVDFIGPVFGDLSDSFWFSDVGRGKIELFPVTRVRLRKDSNVLLQIKGNPIITQKEEGLGDIYYIGIDPGDPAYRNWNQKKDFWEYVLNSGGQSKPYLPVSNPLGKLNNQLISEVSGNYSSGIQKSLFIFIPLLGLVIVIFLNNIRGRLKLIFLVLYPLLWSLLIIVFLQPELPAYFETDIISARLNSDSSRLFVLGKIAVYDAGTYSIGFSIIPDLILPGINQNMNVEYSGDRPSIKFNMESWDKQSFFLNTGYLLEISGSIKTDGTDVTAEIIYPDIALLKYPVMYLRNNYTDDFVFLRENARAFITVKDFFTKDKIGIKKNGLPKYYRNFLSYLEEASFFDKVVDGKSIVLIFQLDEFAAVGLPDTVRKDNKSFIILEIPPGEFIYEE